MLNLALNIWKIEGFMVKRKENKSGNKEEGKQIPSFTTGAEHLPYPVGPAYDKARFVHFLGGLLSLALFILGVHTMTGSFQLLGQAWVDELLPITSNPFISLFVGILATAILQSSSTTTAIIVTLVASNGLALETAIPLILGANIGTAVTSTIVALGHIGNREEFQKAVAGASVHDMFNILTTLILMVLELSTGVISGLAMGISEALPPLEGNNFGRVFYPFKVASEYLILFLGNHAFLSLLVGLTMLFASIRFLSSMLRLVVIGQLKRNLNRYVFEKPLNSFLTGVGATVVLQSSSVTTSLMVPLVATGSVKLKHAFPFIMGANIGTTTTALLAALFNTENPQIALSVAFIHILFNLLGVLVFLPFPVLRKIPTGFALSLGNLAKENRIYGVAYVMLIFFIIPILLIFIGSLL